MQREDNLRTGEVHTIKAKREKQHQKKGRERELSTNLKYVFERVIF